MALHIPESTTSSGIYLPEFRDVEQCPDGTWKAVHVGSLRPVSASTLRRLVYVVAPAVRIAHEWTRA